MARTPEINQFLLGEHDNFDFEIGDFIASVDPGDNLDSGDKIYIAINHNNAKGDMPVNPKSLKIYKDLRRFGIACEPFFDPKAKAKFVTGDGAPYFEIKFQPADHAKWKRADIYDYVTGVLERGYAVYEKYGQEKADRQMTLVKEVLEKFEGETISPEINDQIATAIMKRLRAGRAK